MKKFVFFDIKSLFFTILSIFTLNLSIFAESSISKALKEFSDTKIKSETGIDFYSLLNELSEVSYESDPKTTDSKLESIFEKYLVGNDIKRLFTLIPEIINESIFDKKEKEYIFEDESQFKDYPYAAICKNKKDISSINVIGDVHSSYDIFGLCHRFINNAKSGEYLIFVGDYVDKDYAEEYDKNWRPSCNGYSSIFCFLISGILNAFFVSQKDILNEEFSGQAPLIIFNRGNHESILYMMTRSEYWIDTLVNAGFFKKDEWTSLFNKYMKDSFFLETLVHIPEETSFLIGHSSMLELLESQIDCSKLPKNKVSFFGVNLLNTKDLEVSDLNFNISEILTRNKNIKKTNYEKVFSDVKEIVLSQHEFYMYDHYFETFGGEVFYDITPARFLGDPSNINITHCKHSRFESKIESSKNIFKLNYKNSCDNNFIFCGHSHGKNTVSMHKIISEGNFIGFESKASFSDADSCSISSSNALIFCFNKSGTASLYAAIKKA